MIRDCIHRRQTGFTLIETLVATMILAIGIVTILQLFSGGLRSVSVSENYTRAIFHAREKMNELLMAESLAEGTAEGVFDDGYQWRADLVEIKDEDDKIKLPVTKFAVSLVVLWVQGTKQKQVEFNSIALAKLRKED